MNDKKECKDCGAPLRSVEDLCSNCLLKVGIEETVSIPEETPSRNPPFISSSLPKEGFHWDYEVIEEIARGGMGVVYKARQKSLNRLVAVKMLLAGGFARPELIKRFVSEAEVVAQLDHPHIVPIYEIGRHDGQTYFSMKLIEGGTLKDAVSHLKNNPRKAVELVIKVSKAVHFAHQRGILHRDLKPGNILLDEKGEPWVTDFGLAKLVGQDQELTQTGTILGTPAYMAPEQSRIGGAPLTTASDVYSLGAILYHLLTGRPPFLSEDPIDLLQRTQTEEPQSPLHFNQDLHIDLGTICLKCLEKNTSLRYASALELSQDLERWLEYRPIEARPSGFWERQVKWVQRKPTIATLSILVVLLTVFGLGGLLWQMNQKQIALESARQFALDLATERAPVVEARHSFRHQDWAASVVFSKDGNKLLSCSHDKSVRLTDPFSGETLMEFKGSEGVLSRAEFNHDESLVLAVPIDEGFYFPYLTPDGDPMVSHQGPWYGENGVRIWDAETGDLKWNLQGHSGQVTDARFSPDGKWVASASLDGNAILWDVGDGETVHEFKGHEASIASLAFTPDSQWLATTSMGVIMNHQYVLREDGSSTMSGTTQSAFESDLVKFWDVETGAYIGGFKNRYKKGILGAQKVKDSRCKVTFSGDGKYAVTSAGYPLNTGIWDVASFQWIAGLEGHQHAVLESVFSQNGKLVATACADHIARIFEVPSGHLLAEFKGHDGPVLGVEFSADGKRLLTVSADGYARLWDTQTGYGLAIFKGHADRVVDGSFHPDQFHVVTASRDHTVKIWESGTLEQMGMTFKGHSKQVHQISFHPDSDHFVTSSSDTTARVWSINHPEFTKILRGYSSVRSEVARDRLLGEVTTAKFSVDGNGVWTGARDLAGGYQPSLFFFKMGRVMDLEFAPAKYWDWQSGSVDWGIPNLPSGVENVVEAPNGRYLLVLPDGRYKSGIIDGRGMTRQGSHQQYQVPCDPYLFDTLKRSQLGVLQGFPQQIDKAVFSPNSQWLAICDKLDEVRVYDSSTGELYQKLQHARAGENMFFTQDNSSVFAARHLLEPGIWSVESGKRRLVFKGLDSMMVGAWQGVKDDDIIIFTLNGRFFVFDLITGNLKSSWDTREGLSPAEFRMVRLSPDRRLLALRQQGNLQTIEIWDVKSRSLVSSFRAHQRQINDMAFSPDNQWLATASSDYTVKVWPVGLFAYSVD